MPLPSLKRRLITALLLCACLAACPRAAESSSDQPLFSFGVIADIQYADKPDAGRRSYRASLERLAACVKDFNSRDLAFVIQLGDIIDQDFASFDKVLPIYEQLKAPHYSVVGNHDLAVAADKHGEGRSRLGLQKGYYDFARAGWRFVVLDSMDSDAAQLTWLEETLAKADHADEKAVLFRHHPLYYYSRHQEAKLSEGERKLVRALEAHPCVVAVLNGHLHEGGYGQLNGIHFLTLKGMIESGAQNAYSVVQVFPGRLEIVGIGKEQNRTLKLRGSAAPQGAPPEKATAPPAPAPSGPARQEGR